VLVDSDIVLLFRPMEEREGEDKDSRGGWRNTSVPACKISVFATSSRCQGRSEMSMLWL